MAWRSAYTIMTTEKQNANLYVQYDLNSVFKSAWKDVLKETQMSSRGQITLNLSLPTSSNFLNIQIVPVFAVKTKSVNM